MSAACRRPTNELLDVGIGHGIPSQAFGSYDSNQIGEFLRALTYAIICFGCSGAHVCWLFTEDLDTVGPDARLQEWLRMLDNEYSVQRGWRDFLNRPREAENWMEFINRARTADDYAYRASRNAVLVVGLLGYLGIKHMEEIGRPLHWPLPAPGGADSTRVR